MRFHTVTALITGGFGTKTVHYTERLAPRDLETLWPIVCLPPTDSVLIPMPAGMPALRLKWTPDPDGTAILNFYGGPAEADMITTCVLLPQGRLETQAIAETLNVFLRPPLDLSELPEGPTLVAVPWPNLKHLDAFTVVGDIEVCLAGAYFLSRCHARN